MKHTVLYKSLQEAMACHRLVAAYCNDWRDDYYKIGFVHSFARSVLELERVNEYGEPKGLMKLGIDDIDEIVMLSPFLRGIEYLIKNDVHFDESQEQAVAAKRDFIPTLDKLFHTREFATLVIGQEIEYIGYINRYTTDFVELQVIDCDTGTMDGEVMIRISSISSIIFGGIVEQKATYLHEHFNKEWNTGS